MTDFSHCLIASRPRTTWAVERHNANLWTGGLDHAARCEGAHGVHWYAIPEGSTAEDIAQWYAACESSETGITHYARKLGDRHYEMVDALVTGNPPDRLLEDGQEDALDVWEQQLEQALLSGNWRGEEVVG